MLLVVLSRMRGAPAGKPAYGRHHFEYPRQRLSSASSDILLQSMHLPVEILNSGEQPYQQEEYRSQGYQPVDACFVIVYQRRLSSVAVLDIQSGGGHNAGFPAGAINFARALTMLLVVSFRMRSYVGSCLIRLANRGCRV